MSDALANMLGALSIAVMDRIGDAAREVLDRGGEAPAALIVIGYGRGITNDRLRRILGLSHSGAVRLVDRLVSDQLVERRPGRDGREIALHLTPEGVRIRVELLAARISVVGSMLEALSSSERDRFAALIHKLLAGQTTSEQDRFTICRLCDDSVCTSCPLPTTKPAGAQTLGGEPDGHHQSVTP